MQKFLQQLNVSEPQTGDGPDVVNQWVRNTVGRMRTAALRHNADEGASDAWNSVGEPQSIDVEWKVDSRDCTLCCYFLEF